MPDNMKPSEYGRFMRKKKIGYGPPSFVNAVKMEPGAGDVSRNRGVVNV